MFVNSSVMLFVSDLTNMRVTQSTVLSPELTSEAQKLGTLLARLRLSRGIKQQDAAVRAGISRNTAYRLEQGDPGLAVGQILRYLDAIAPGQTLRELLAESNPALVALGEREKKKRVRDMSSEERSNLDF